MKHLRSRLTYANVIATLALFLALGGGAYAATQLPKNSIGSKQIKKGSIQVNDLSKAARIQLKGAKGATGVKGATGTKGAPGPKGATGAQGPTGPAGLATTTLQSGQTLRGIVNVDTEGTKAGQITGSSISFPLSLAKAPTVEILKEGAPPTSNCSGTIKEPTAAPGVLCVYEVAVNNVSQFAICGIECLPESPAASRFGAEIFVHATAVGRYFASATWAVTAP